MARINCVWPVSPGWKGSPIPRGDQGRERVPLSPRRLFSYQGCLLGTPGQ